MAGHDRGQHEDTAQQLQQGHADVAQQHEVETPSHRQVVVTSLEKVI